MLGEGQGVNLISDSVLMCNERCVAETDQPLLSAFWTSCALRKTINPWEHEGIMGQSPGGRTPGKEQMNFAGGTMNMATVAELMVLMVSLYSIHQPMESLCGGACRGRRCPRVVSWPSTCWASSSRSVLIPGWQ